MAAIHAPASNQYEYEPQARYGHCTAFVNGKIVVYGGHITGTRNTLPLTVVDVFDPATEKWDQITTTGPPPPGFISASCAVIGIDLYVFSGWNGNTHFNHVHQLNTHSQKWTKLDDANQGEAPMAKSGAAMVSYKEKMLITIGGYGILPYLHRPGTEYTRHPDVPGHGYTNELLCFDVHSRTWSSPHTTGTPPPASKGHSFTMVDLHRAVLFGGTRVHLLLRNYVYILDVQQWVWTTITSHSPGPGWLAHRVDHSAVSLHDPDGDLTPDPALMVMWGVGSDNAILSDSWVFQVNLQQWRKVTLRDTLKGRCTHSTTIVHTGPTLKKLVTYGGLGEFHRNPRDSNTYIAVAETTVVDIESLQDVWDVRDVRRLGRSSTPSTVPQEPPSSDQKSESTIADTKPKSEPPSPKDEKPTLKTEPASPIKKEIKSEQVKPLSDSEQDEDLVLKEVAHLREIVAHQKMQFMEYQEMYEKPLQDEKPTLKTEPASPIKKEIKSEQVRPLSDSKQDEDSVLKEVALLREIVAHHKKQIMEYQEMYEKPLQEGQTLPTSEQAVRTYGENTSDLRTTEYLRGFESFAETSFVITGTHSHSFEWQGYGLKLHIPEGAVPTDHSECRIDIKVGLSGQFGFPDDSQLVSCVYWISCSHTLLKAVTLDIEHCSSVQHTSQPVSLCFIAAKCSQAKLPYHFSELKQATFSPHSSFGSVQVSQFSFFGIVRKIFSLFRNEEPRCYCGNLYYMNKGLNDWRVDFVIMWNLSGYCKAVEKAYAGHTSDDPISMAVEFQEDTITLAVPVDGEVLENGWKITPLVPPTIRKGTVDNFRPGQQLPSCCLSVEWTREDHAIKLMHRISLVGAKKPFNFFYIKLIPEVLLTEGLKQHSQKRRRKQQENHHNGKSKREKLSIEPEIHTDIPEAVSPSSSEDAATPMAEEVDKLDQDNHIEITGYLLGLDKTHVYHLGLVLGLSEPRVREMEDSKTFLDDMVVAWLQKVDQVQKRGAPSWRRLVEALRDRRVGQNGIARKILQDRILKQN